MLFFVEFNVKFIKRCHRYSLDENNLAQYFSMDHLECILVSCAMNCALSCALVIIRLNRIIGI